MGLTEQDIAEAHKNAARASRASAAVEAIAKGKPGIAQLPALRRFLLGEHDAAAKLAAQVLRRLGPKAREAADDLVTAATMPWVFGCPQRFVDSVEALLRVAPDHPRLVAICRDSLRCENYGIQKVAIVSLSKIGTPEAVEILRDIDSHRDTSIRGKAFDTLMAKVRKDLG